MEPLKIEKGASKVRRTALKATIDGAVADDLERMARWSENDASYLVNLLLRFAIAQSLEFQKHKAETSAAPVEPARAERAAETPRSRESDEEAAP